MKLQIDEKYRIASDSQCWMVQKYCGIDEKKNRERWNPITYHGSLENCVNSLSERMLRESEVTTLVEALEEVKSIAKKLKKALQPKYEVKDA